LASISPSPGEPLGLHQTNSAGQDPAIAACGQKQGHGCKAQMFGSQKQVRGKGGAD
jgi:hypothetical protein